MYNSKGEKTWQVEYDIYGKVRKLVKGSLNDCPFRYPGQYEDIETGLYYNRFRYYSPDEGVYISQDPIKLSGGDNLYAYTKDVNLLVDPMGLTPLDQKGFSVYGLYEEGAKEPYYVGISNNTDVREGQHIDSGRMGDTDTMQLLDSNTDMTYAEARGKEQHLIEKHKTKTGKIGQDLTEDGLTAKQRGNKVNSFDKTRTDARGKKFKAEYDKAKGKPKVKCK
ncbi:RHS repeat-associated core domain-containing protein [uncultured Aquimarina sp.]|uniref:RHS repeat-associated core domain-containing protein n=1 Tax=uncultured Aquimarina sp. TaxID=575652 RepID=UPI0026193F7C|nr:RHS repeat-associated core domain-containing protein [uncultured Aquimarina sp.]